MLFNILEFSDLFVDACLRDSSGELMFLSLYGRDTAIQQFKAAMQLSRANGGITSFTLRRSDSQSHFDKEHVMVGDADRFEVYSGRLPAGSLFGNLSHTWIYDPVLVKPDKVTGTGWIVQQKSADVSKPIMDDVIWETYRQLSPVPLLDEWRADVMSMWNEVYLTRLEDTAFPPLGNVDAAKLVLDDDFASVISEMLRTGVLSVDGVRYVPKQVPVESNASYTLTQAMAVLKPFISSIQARVLLDASHGEEGEYFKRHLGMLADRIQRMPVTNQTSDHDDPIVSLHYFFGGSDWFIIEKDVDGGVLQAFGYACLNQDLQFAELEYISISELVGYGVELDLHFEPRPLSQVKAELHKRCA